ncbi:MAG TPA: UDP-N-acetylglucosamine 2-epimerase (non-hydrolyzing), partial [Gemmatimonadaceae bacterium]|nr:UDP-N-acetylglucosamine 2-epimerase (non-hydrolyzing) [Gemmatimonadaceae bacterium]
MTEPAIPQGLSADPIDLVLVAGARPNFVKLAPLHHALEAHSTLRKIIVHTGQHYDDAMSDVFFRELRIPSPNINLEVGPGTHAEQTAGVMVGFERVVQRLRPRCIVLFGDVNSTVACALVAAKLGVPVAHVEAGLRSNDWSMPEEVNRVVTDRLSSRLYAPSKDACENLAHEGISLDRIRLVGNIMVDTLLAQLPSVDQAQTLREFGLEQHRFILVTLHRPSNVDDESMLKKICEVLRLASQQEPVLFPAHPRSLRRLRDLQLEGSLGATRIVPPLPYRAFLGLMASARAVVTDSGGVQEETTALGVPCLTLRPNTERPITITEGTNQLVKAEPSSFRRALETANGRRHRVPELWDGRT